MNTLQSIEEASSPAARTLLSFGNFALISLLAVAAIVIALTLWAALRRRGSLTEHAPPDAGGGMSWVIIGGLVIPVMVLGLFLVLTFRTMNKVPLHTDAAHAAEIRLIGHQWWWEIRYEGNGPAQQVVTANELHIPIGQSVSIELESVDVIHSLWIPRLHGKVDLIPGRVNRVDLGADTAGSYMGQCAEYCGAEHAAMRLIVVVEPQQDYARWLQGQMQPAASAPGQALFETRACGICHTVRGTLARGTVGPDLTHIASRQRIGANILPRQHATLEAWMARAQSFKPGAQMPNLSGFSGTELDQLTTYLEALR